MSTATTARTMLDTTPPQLVITSPTGDMLDTRSHPTLGTADAETLLTEHGWTRADAWHPEYDFEDDGNLTLVGYTTTVR
ncbi:hypothetical protein SAMN04487819_1343 [Actinopolyspora alba]|uniref:Uncharacterized protein n=1 Tax=Actinopolyspora alba TaxID=673379 RepID=A0A1I2CQ95_9ACTN|nr:hypothetical protein [Actinopolyspora alba]SFE70404.1 hypothetical protein SAMN04487819_1343 [Actinopolyspora alba]